MLQKIQNIINYNKDTDIITSNLEPKPIKQELKNSLLARIAFLIRSLFSNIGSTNPKKIASEIRSLLSKENMDGLNFNEFESLHEALLNIKSEISSSPEVDAIFNRVISGVLERQQHSQEVPSFADMGDRYLEILDNVVEDKNDSFEEMLRLTSIKIEK